MVLQLGTNVPEDHSILKTVADLMVEKVFEAKVNNKFLSHLYQNAWNFISISFTVSRD